MTNENMILLGLVYEEKCRKWFMDMSELTHSDCNWLRKACGKREPELIAKWKRKFIDTFKSEMWEFIDPSKAFDLLADAYGTSYPMSHAVGNFYIKVGEKRKS